MAHTKRLGDMKLSQTVFFLCDMQERFRPAIKYFDDIVEVARRLVNVDNFNGLVIKLLILYIMIIIGLAKGEWFL